MASRGWRAEEAEEGEGNVVSPVLAFQAIEMGEVFDRGDTEEGIGVLCRSVEHNIEGGHSVSSHQFLFFAMGTAGSLPSLSCE